MFNRCYIVWLFSVLLIGSNLHGNPAAVWSYNSDAQFTYEVDVKGELTKLIIRDKGGLFDISHIVQRDKVRGFPFLSVDNYSGVIYVGISKMVRNDEKLSLLEDLYLIKISSKDQITTYSFPRLSKMPDFEKPHSVQSTFALDSNGVKVSGEISIVDQEKVQLCKWSKFSLAKLEPDYTNIKLTRLAVKANGHDYTLPPYSYDCIFDRFQSSGNPLGLKIAKFPNNEILIQNVVYPRGEPIRLFWFIDRLGKVDFFMIPLKSLTLSTYSID